MSKIYTRLTALDAQWFVWFGMLFILMTSVGIRIHALDQIHFDGLYGQDAYAYYGYGVDIKSALHEVRSPAATYWPLGYPILLALSFLALGTSPDTAQILSIALGALSSLLVFRLMFDYTTKHLQWSLFSAISTGLVAGLIFTLSGQVLQSSVVVMSDVPAVFWALLSLWSLLQYHWQLDISHLAWRWIFLTGVALGMAAITRWIFGLLIVPWELACLLIWRGRLKWRDLLIALIPFSIIIGLQLLHSRQNPTAFYDHQWLQTWDISHANQQDFINADGTFQYEKTQFDYYADMYRNDTYLVYPLVIYLGLGMVGLLSNLRRNIMLIILMSGWVGTTFIFLVGIPYQNIRFALAFFPPLVMVSALGWGYVWQGAKRLPRLKWIVLIVLIISLIKPMHISYQTGFEATETLANRKSKDLKAIEWAKSQISENEPVVYSLNLHLMLVVYAPDFTNRQIFYETPETLANRIDPQQPTYILLNNWSIQNQWEGKSPQIALQWLMDNFDVETIGRSGNYYLWRIQSTPVG